MVPVAVVVIVSIIAIAVVRIVATYHVFSNTFDEGAHVAAGMEVFERGTYTFDQEHAPLARLATATLPYLSGLRLNGATNMWDGGFEVLYANGSYSRNLALARAGILPFFVLAAVVVFLWARQYSTTVSRSLRSCCSRRRRPCSPMRVWRPRTWPSPLVWPLRSTSGPPRQHPRRHRRERCFSVSHSASRS